MGHLVRFLAAAVLAAGLCAVPGAPLLAVAVAQDVDDDVNDDLDDEIDDDVDDEIDDDIDDEIDDDLDDEIDDDLDDDFEDDFEDDFDREDLERAARGLDDTERRIAVEIDEEGARVLEREWVVLAETGDGEAYRRSGFAVLERRDLGALGGVLLRILAPRSFDPETVARRLREVDPGALVDRNHLYTPQRATPADGSPAALAPPADAAGGAGLLVGVVDGAANRRHPALRRADIETADFSGAAPAAIRHGTAVVSVLVGEARGFRGVAPRARIRLAAALFETEGGAEAASVAGLVAALDWLLSEETPVVLMSLAGPPNTILERAVGAAGARGTTVVAAVGNRGPVAPPQYPSAYDGVVGVTAVDAAGAPYRLAGRGDHVDFAAPGVDVRTAAAGGGYRTISGTSFAAPFVAAALAGLKREAGGDAVTLLAARVQDRGAPGRDPVFGYGVFGNTFAAE
ncbi:MAG: S8 family serine peptidase [Pseudomonadota bacterium]